ncbi:hypothetical protein [Haloarcula salina]|uniref:Uncharacterized protein n=1 Tax=Haloarcula salina TaxID=1429914 RepID=A0AA41KF39_9EURY|nr:hypothetical protein [Haloarcula salina]MBV0901662.1 hypothetical protein [Haloarcula salina]
MAQRQSTRRYGDPTDPVTAAALAERVGLALVAVTLPLALVAFTGLAMQAASPSAALTTAAAAMQGPVLAGRGLTVLFHAGALGTLLGCWLLGLGLLLDGLYD